MNLNKLFNYKYFLQNVKKSKMVFALFFIVLPVFTSLMIMASDNFVFDFISLASINIFGMYIIPFIFSICLFGYLYKKNSVDFIGSMPISRRSIFTTNTIGGIAIIFIMQLLTFLLTILISSLTKSTVFVSMAWDVLVFQTISYIFVFIAANLAMSISGTLTTQIAVTMLIVFIVPFSTWYISIMSNNEPYTLVNNDIELISLDKTRNYTAPFLVANGDYEYNTVSIYKMLILSIIYFVVGLFLFEKRKMEVAGESFENKYAHFIIKGLTLIPFVAILMNIIDYDEKILSIIIVAIIAVYYLVFDLITSKKVKFYENIIALIVSITTIYGIYSLGISIDEHIDKKLNIDSIKIADINIDNRFYTTLTDKEIIKSTLVKLSNKDLNYYTTGSENKHTYTVKLELIRNDGTRFNARVYAIEDRLSEILDDAYRSIDFDNSVIISNNRLILTKKQNEEVVKNLNETLKDATFKDVIKYVNNVSYPNIRFNKYKNHRLIDLTFSLRLNKDIQKIIITAENNYAINALKNGLRDVYFTINSFNKFNEETRRKVYFVNSIRSEEKYIQFILDNENNYPENIEKCISIGSNRFVFYTDKIDDFLNMINKICEDNKEDYEMYISGYDYDYNYDYDYDYNYEYTYE